MGAGGGGGWTLLGKIMVGVGGGVRGFNMRVMEAVAVRRHVTFAEASWVMWGFFTRSKSGHFHLCEVLRLEVDWENEYVMSSTVGYNKRRIFQLNSSC